MAQDPTGDYVSVCTVLRETIESARNSKLLAESLIRESQLTIAASRATRSEHAAVRFRFANWLKARYLK